MEWNNTVESWPHDILTHQLFESQAQKTPDRIAVEFGDKSRTYSELNHQAQALANKLVALGAGPERVVGLCLERSIKIVEGVLGILKSGAAYLPIESSYPQERQTYMLEDSEACILVCEKATKNCAAKFKGPRLILDGEMSLEGAESLRPVSSPHANNLAYIIYTSGSTGTPKGVAIEHNSFTNVLFSLSRLLEIQENEVVLSVAPFSFDVALPDWFWALMFGGKLILVEGPTIHDPRKMIQKILATKPTHIQAPPLFWEVLLGEGTAWPKDIRIISTGEHMSDALRENLRSKSNAVWNLYGPTETTVWSTACNIHEDTHSNSIGVAIGNTTLHILNEDGEPAGINETGELFIGGVGLARGYVKQETLTAERFGPVPRIGPERLYRTGDLVQRKPDNTLLFLGRKDHQIKIRGFRVELGEIDAAMRMHPDIISAVTILREDNPEDKQIVSYVVRKSGSTTRFWEYRDFLEKSLPLYMIPTGIEVLDKLPLNSNGKVDRKKLPKPSTERRDLNTAYLKPEGEIENQLAEIWEEVLEIKNVGAVDNFFDVGGHSVTAMRIVSRVRQVFDEIFPVSAIFGAPTIRLFAQLIKDVKSDSA